MWVGIAAPPVKKHPPQAHFPDQRETHACLFGQLCNVKIKLLWGGGAQFPLDVKVSHLAVSGGAMSRGILFSRVGCQVYPRRQGGCDVRRMVKFTCETQGGCGVRSTDGQVYVGDPWWVV